MFTRTKHGANRVVKELLKGHVASAAIHGNKSQGARQRALAGFKSGDLRVLVATDIASRGIDVDGVSHVINYDLPNIPESYVHRIGRTARAGKEGIAIGFCDESELEYLKDIEKLIGESIRIDRDHPRHYVDILSAPEKPKKRQFHRRPSGPPRPRKAPKPKKARAEKAQEGGSSPDASPPPRRRRRRRRIS